MTTSLTLSLANQDDQKVGAKPASITWNVVRGDTASILVSFLQDDQATAYNTSGWTYVAKAYNSKTDTHYALTTEVISGSVKISATPEVTATWGSDQRGRPETLTFDLQVTIDSEVVWTPIIGVIYVIKDVPAGANS